MGDRESNVSFTDQPEIREYRRDAPVVQVRQPASGAQPAQRQEDNGGGGRGKGKGKGAKGGKDKGKSKGKKKRK